MKLGQTVKVCYAQQTEFCLLYDDAFIIFYIYILRALKCASTHKCIFGTQNNRYCADKIQPCMHTLKNKHTWWCHLYNLMESGPALTRRQPAGWAVTVIMIWCVGGGKRSVCLCVCLFIGEDCHLTDAFLLLIQCYFLLFVHFLTNKMYWCMSHFTFYCFNLCSHLN